MKKQIVSVFPLPSGTQLIFKQFFLNEILNIPFIEKIAKINSTGY